MTINGCEPQNPFIPSNTNETCGGTSLDQMFTGLVSYEPETAAPYNAVAQEFATEDNQTWTITLNEDYTFHDGTPVTAQSFVDAWNWSAYGPNAQLNTYFFGPDGAADRRATPTFRARTPTATRRSPRTRLRSRRCRVSR